MYAVKNGYFNIIIQTYKIALTFINQFKILQNSIQDRHNNTNI